VLNGNHETMNVSSNHRYATPGATVELMRWQRWQALGRQLKQRCKCYTASAASVSEAQRAPGPPANLFGAAHFVRTEAMQPGSELTQRFMAEHPIVLQVGSNLFVHGGVLPSHVEYGLQRINQETKEWMLQGSALKPPAFLRGASAIVWARDYSAEDEDRCDCSKLQQVLQSIPGAKRMVVGHTIQGGGINSACEGQVMRIDVGMSRGCGDREPQVLEILDDKRVRRLREGQAPEEVSRTAPPQDHGGHHTPGVDEGLLRRVLAGGLRMS